MFHVRYTGHSTEDYLVFKNKIHDLINQNILCFTEEKPNVRTNPLSTHNGPAVSAIIEEEATKSVRGVTNVKTPMRVVIEKLWKHGFPGRYS